MEILAHILMLFCVIHISASSLNNSEIVLLHIVGMQQHYALGQYFRRRYIEGYPYQLLDANYSRYQVQVRSTDYDRTLMSAYSNLAGFFPPNGSQVWNPSIEWQPIPVHTVPKISDNLLYTDCLCPKYDDEYEKVLKSELVKKEEERNKMFYEFIGNVTGRAHEGIRNIWKVFDPLFCEKTHNFSLPSWVNRTWDGETAFDKLRKLKDFGFELQFNRPILKRLRGGNLLGAVLRNMNRTARGLRDKTKCYIYSAHDSTVAAFTSALNVFNNILPPYATAVLVELIKADQKFFVQILYKNVSSGDPYKLTVPGCAELCPLETFTELLSGNIPVDWHAECQSGGVVAWAQRHVATGFIATAAVGLFLLLCVVLVLFAVRRRRQKVSGREYRQLQFADG